MEKDDLRNDFEDIWQHLPEDSQKPGDILLIVILGFLIGFCSGLVIAFFRITTNRAYGFALEWTARHAHSILYNMLWFGCATAAALIVGLLMRNPSIRFGGSLWDFDAIRQTQPRAWIKILIPKFIGSWLVMAFGISVGREGPCIQMGAATAMGIKNLDATNAIERRFFILGGCAAGLSAAFSAPFAGICYVYEIMRENISRPLCLFLLGGAFGVYLSTTQIFGLGVMMSFGATPMPGLAQVWILVPLAILAAGTGIAYNYLLRASIALYSRQKLLSFRLRPLMPFLGAAVMVLVFPAITGEGLSIFASIKDGQALAGYLCLFLLAKIFFTAYCYGSGIPAGLMVPVLCLGGVTGGLYAHFMLVLGLLPAHFESTCIVMGMSGAFAAAQRAPVTALVLVLEMTDSWSTAPGMLLVAAIAVFLARVARVRDV